MRIITRDGNVIEDAPDELVLKLLGVKEKETLKVEFVKPEFKRTYTKRKYKGSNKNNVWTEEEENFLREHYNKYGPKRCARELKRALTAVYARASYLGITQKGQDEQKIKERKTRGKIKQSRWTEKEDNFLRERYNKLGGVKCAKRLGRTHNATLQRANTLGIHRIKTVGTAKIQKKRKYGWTSEQEEKLRELSKTHTDEEIAGIFAKGKEAIKWKREQLRIKKKRGKIAKTRTVQRRGYQRISQNDLDTIKKLYKTHTDREISKITGIPPKTISLHRLKHNWRKQKTTTEQPQLLIEPFDPTILDIGNIRGEQDILPAIKTAIQTNNTIYMDMIRGIDGDQSKWERVVSKILMHATEIFNLFGINANFTFDHNQIKIQIIGEKDENK